MEKSRWYQYFMHSVCLQPLAPHCCSHPTRAPFSFIHAGCVPVLRRFLPDIPISPFPPMLLLSLLSLSSISLFCPPFAFPLSSPSLFPFPSLSPSLVVDWVSECLWQLCVVCNRAERLVWIQWWENLFMWEMHRWRQVSRRHGPSLAVILYSGRDRRSEMAKYARRLPQIPKLHTTIQPRCVCVYSDLTEWFCVYVHLKRTSLGQRAWSDSPAIGSVQGPLPLSDRGEKVYQLFCFYPIPVISLWYV